MITNIIHNILNITPKTRYNRKYFQHTMQFAHLIIEKSSSQTEKINGIIHLIKIQSLSIQTKIIEDVIVSDLHKSKRPDFLTFFYNFCIDMNFDDCFFSVKDNPIVTKNLSSFPSITVPWHKERLAKSLWLIGTKNLKPFREDLMNHFANTLIFPLCLMYIPNGTHSSTVGIFEDNATMTIHQVMDISSSFKYYSFNGTHFVSNDRKLPHIKPDFIEIGIIYELGRILWENHLLKCWKDS